MTCKQFVMRNSQFVINICITKQDEKHEVLRKKKLPTNGNCFIFLQDNVSEVKLYHYTAMRRTRSIAEKETISKKCLIFYILYGIILYGKNIRVDREWGDPLS